MTATRWTLLVIAAIALLPLVALIALDISSPGAPPTQATDPANGGLDPELVEAAGEVCAAAQRQAAAGPPVTDESTFEERAQAVERLADLYDETALRLVALPGARDDPGFAAWVEDWHELADLGREYAEAIRTRDRATFEAAGNAADEPAQALSAYARENRIEGCPIG